MRVAALLFTDSPDSLAPFAEACLRFSPQLCLKRPGVIFIEIGKCRKLYKAETFLARLSLLLKRFELKAHVAIGETILDSLLLARHGTRDHHALRTSAFHEYFDPYQSNPDSAKVVDRIVDNLEQVGIRSVKEFLAIPAHELTSRFGAAGSMIRARILGEMDAGWPLWVPEERVSERIELYESEHCQTLEPLLFYLKPVLDRAFSRLWGRGLRASCIRLRLKLEKHSAVKEPVREWRMDFILPQTTARGTLPIVRERLERDLQRQPLESSVIAVDLEILQSTRDYQGQRHFFHQREDIEEAFNSAIAQLAESLGKNKVFRAKLHEEAVAERSWSRCFEDQKVLPDLEGYIPLRPTKLLKRPLRVHLMDEMLFIKSRPYRILSRSAVEEIATHWEDQEIVRSYRTFVLDGKRSPVWVFKCPKDDYWLHGYFG